MKKINWGIIGLGNIANKFAEGFSNLNNANLKGLASRNKVNLENFQKKFQVDNKFCFNNYIDLILSPEIDIIYIALPNSLHAIYTNKAIKQKKNILVEKPAFTNIQDFKIIKRLFENNKVFLTEGFMYRYLPYFQKIKDIIDNNNLGKVINMSSTFNIKVYKQKNFFGIKIRKPNYNHRLFNKDLGGGVILDVGCYPLSLSTYINSITYKVETNDIHLENVETENCDNGVDIYSTLKLNFSDKFYSKITCSFKDQLNQNTKINFEHGSLNIEETWVPNQNMSIEINNRDKKSKIDFLNNKNIYSYQIENISQKLLDKKKISSFPSMTMEEIEINTKILDEWINFK